MSNNPNDEKINQQGGVNIVNSKVTVKGDVVGRDKNIFNIFSGKDAEQDRRNQLILLDKVKTFWIEGVLERSVYSVMRIDLGAVEETGAVDRPWDMVVESEGAEKIQIPHGQAIIETFDAMNHSLLILGAPGSGKTMTLLELANDLLKRASESPNAPIPVVFNLSSWVTRQQPLADWLVEELQTKYQIPRKMSKQWIKDGVILPLLDGLDEVHAESREACVVAINKFQTDYGLLGGIVVCSRVEEYNALKTHLKLQGAILIQPLTQDQVNDWLNAAGDKLASLRSALLTDATLRELTQTPLMLTVMGLAYQNRQVETTTVTSVESRRQQIFGAYIDQMFKRVARTKSQLYSRGQTLKWLAWLAKKMQAHGQSVFLVDGLQPSWLHGKRKLWLYFFLSRFTSVVAFSIAVNVFVQVTPLMTMVFGISWAIVDLLLASRPNFAFRSATRLIALTFAWMLASFSNLVAVTFSYTNVSADYWTMPVLEILLAPVILGPFFGMYGVEDKLEKDIRFLGTLGWSWRRAGSGSIIGFGIGVVVSVIAWLAVITVLEASADLFEPPYTFILFCGVFMPFFGLMVGVPIGALFGGIVPKISRGQSASSWTSKLKNWVVASTPIVLVVSFLWVLLSAFAISFLGFAGVVGAIILGVFAGVLAMFWFGIFSAIRHFTLRFIITFSEHIPFNLSRFLDYAVDRIFMQRVGNGYIFIHRALLEYFAEQ